MAKLQKKSKAKVETPRPDARREVTAKKSFFGLRMQKSRTNLNSEASVPFSQPQYPDLPYSIPPIRPNLPENPPSYGHEANTSGLVDRNIHAPPEYPHPSEPACTDVGKCHSCTAEFFVHDDLPHSSKPRHTPLHLPVEPSDDNTYFELDSPHRKMFELTTEIWAIIASMLTPLEVANLAISNKLFRCRLGQQAWSNLNLAQNKLDRTKFLLTWDYALPDQLLCFICGVYHLRIFPTQEKLTPNYVQEPPFVCPNFRNALLPRTRVAHGRVMPLYLPQLALRADRLTAAHGIPLANLSRSWKCRDSNWSHRTRFHIHDNHIYMRVTSTCFAKPNLTSSEQRLLLFSRSEYAPYFSVCDHWQNSDLMSFAKCALSHVPTPGKPSGQQRKASLIPSLCEDCKSLRRCAQCPTEYLIEVKLIEDSKDRQNPFKHALSITRWSDLGDASSPDCLEWCACNGTAVYHSFRKIKDMTICTLFENAVSQSTPNQKLQPLGNSKKKMGTVY